MTRRRPAPAPAAGRAAGAVSDVWPERGRAPGGRLVVEIGGWSRRLEPARRELVREGLDVHAALSVERWDAVVAPAFRSEHLLPEARSVWLVGAGGRALFARFEEALAARAALRADPDPFDRRLSECLSAARDRAEVAGVRCALVPGHQPEGGCFPDLVAAAREAGLGWPSRLGLLIHPELGPWMSLRAAFLTDESLPEGQRLTGAGPCAGCPAPCTARCPVAAPAAEGFGVRACAGFRASGGCASRCAARRACPVGADHAYSDGGEAWHMAGSLAAMKARA